MDPALRSGWSGLGSIDEGGRPFGPNTAVLNDDPYGSEKRTVTIKAVVPPTVDDVNHCYVAEKWRPWFFGRKVVDALGLEPRTR